MTMTKRYFMGSMVVFSLIFSTCTYTERIKDGRTAFDRKQYSVATKLLEKEFNRANTKGEKSKKALLLAQSYQQLHDEAATGRWFKIAYDNNAGTDALRDYALSLKRQQQYQTAVETFTQLGSEIGSPYEYRKEITACQQAADWLKDTIFSAFSVETLPYNSAKNDYAPADWQGKIVFSSDRNPENSKKTAAYSWTGNAYARLWVVEKNNAEASLQFTNLTNSLFNEATATFSGDGNTAVFTRCGEAGQEVSYCRLYETTRRNTTWSEPEKLAFQNDKNKTNYGTPTLSADGRTLIFSSNDGDGWGGYDLYTVSRNRNNEWGEPRIISRSVNTTGNEMYPTLDGDTLYFASDMHVGMGGLDVFKTYKIFDAKGNYAWASPQNMLPPINSGGDDFQFTVVKNDAKKYYFTSNRNGGKGGDDLYLAQSITPKQRPTPPVVVVPPKTDETMPIKPKITYKISLNVYVVEKIFAQKENPNSGVVGKKPLTEAKLFRLDGKNTVEMPSKRGDTGGVLLELDENTDYVFSASQDGYLTSNARFSTKGIARDPQKPTQSFDLEIVLDKIYKNQEIVLENIYYDYNKSDIRSDAAPTLEKLAETLRQNPTVRIQLGSHTDCRGNDRYNENLSQRRAEAAVNYLIGTGIEAARLVARGYGESQPAANCACNNCSETEHQTNRRTTFKILD